MFCSPSSNDGLLSGALFSPGSDDPIPAFEEAWSSTDDVSHPNRMRSLSLILALLGALFTSQARLDEGLQGAEFEGTIEPRTTVREEASYPAALPPGAAWGSLFPPA